MRKPDAYPEIVDAPDQRSSLRQGVTERVIARTLGGSNGLCMGMCGAHGPKLAAAAERPPSLRQVDARRVDRRRREDRSIERFSGPSSRPESRASGPVSAVTLAIAGAPSFPRPVPPQLLSREGAKEFLESVSRLWSSRSRITIFPCRTAVYSNV